MTASLLAGVPAQCALAFLIGGALGDRMSAAFARERSPGLPERALFAIAGFCAFCVALMVGNLVTGGAVFGVPFVVPVAGALVLTAGWRAGSRIPRPRAHITWLLGAALVLLYVLPVLIAGSGVRTGDPPWHLGWAEQLLRGESIPTGPAPEFARNAYPWGLHAVQATLVRLVPGTDALTSLESLHVIVLVGIPLGAACLARRVRGDAGLPAAAAASLVGGWGWVSARTPDFVTTPLEARYGADLVVASPNSVYELLPPAFPRELGLVLLAAVGMCLMLGARGGQRQFALAGGLTGLIGLVSVPMFLSGLGWGLVALSARARGTRLRAAGWFAVPALLVFSLWAGSIAADYVRFGGFVNITERLGVEWPLSVALASWGFLLPAAAGGVWWAVQRDGNARVMVGFASLSVVLLALAMARARFDWTLQGNATLLHQGRVWPALHLIAAALAGVAIAALWQSVRAKRRSRALVFAAGVMLLGTASISPVFASIHLTRILEAHEAGFVYGSQDFATDSFVARVSERVSPDDSLAVRGSDELRGNRLAFFLWQFSGARLADFPLIEPDANPLRIRFAELAEDWGERIEEDGFHADYVVTLADEVPQNAVVLERGIFRDRDWVLIDETASAR